MKNAVCWFLTYMCSNVRSTCRLISSALGHICVMWWTYLFRAYASNVKCMCTSVPHDIVDCSEFI